VRDRGQRSRETDHLDDRLAENHQDSVAVLLIDVNHLGYDAGDRFIKAFTGLLRDAIDIPATLARFGGDDFVVVPTMPMEVEEAEVFAKTLQERVRSEVKLDGKSSVAQSASAS